MQTLVYLVEDDDGEAALVERALRADDLVVTRFADLATVLDALGSSAPHVLLLDLSLPDSSGLDSLDAVTAAAPTVPVVILTALEDEASALRALRRGAQDYLVKSGFAGGGLLRAVRYAVERRRTEGLRARLLEADRLATVGQLAAGVANEISNPAAFLTANLSLMREDLSGLKDVLRAVRRRAAELGTETASSIDAILSRGKASRILEDADEMLDDSLAGLARIRSVVRDLKSFSRLDRSEVALVQLNEVVEAACTIAHNEIRYRARLEKQLRELPPIAADRAKLTQVLVNLLVYSAHSIVEGDADANRIELRTRHADGRLLIEIRDTGRPLREHETQRLFAPLLSTDQPPDSPGLGLSLAAEVVRQHGGELEARALPDGGNRYRLALPEVSDLRDLVPAPEPEESASGPRRRYRVLLVDDDPLVRRSFRRLLASHCDVIEAEGGQAALELLEEDDRFDVVLCDIMMPRMDGVAFYERVVAEGSPLAEQFVFVSGGTFTRRTHEFVDSTGHIVLEKPVRRDLLLAVIERVASSRSGRPVAH